MEIIKAIKNPRDFVLNQMGINNNPMLKKLVEMAESGQKKEIETFARNFFKENGGNFEKEYAEFVKLIQK